MQFPRYPTTFLILLALGLMCSGTALAQSQRLQISIQTLAPEEIVPGKPAGIVPSLLVAAFHNGSADLLDVGQPASGAVSQFAGTGNSDQLEEAIAGSDSDAKIVRIANVGVVQYRRHISTAEPPEAYVDISPDGETFVSILGRISPSDDAIFGNDDPMRYRVFDEDGNFLGPIVIEIYGEDILDAGAWRNDETGMHESCEFSDGAPVAEENIIRVHPGFHGSLSLPDAAPQNILGNDVCLSVVGAQTQWNVGLEAGDFKRAGYPIARIRITKGVGGEMSGSWYRPSRDGEGFFFEITDSDNPRLVANWFSYKPDGSGEQIWLTGVGPIDPVFGSQATLQMYITKGPVFGSEYDPQHLDIRPWGELDVRFTNCARAEIEYSSQIPSYGSGSFAIQRLTPELLGQSDRCAWFLSPGRFFTPNES